MLAKEEVDQVIGDGRSKLEVVRQEVERQYRQFSS